MDVLGGAARPNEKDGGDVIGDIGIGARVMRIATEMGRKLAPVSAVLFSFLEQHNMAS